MIVVSPASTAGRGSRRHRVRPGTKTTLCGESAVGWKVGDAGSIDACGTCVRVEELVELVEPKTTVRCSECLEPVKQPSRGRKRDTCSRACGRARDARQRREERARRKMEARRKLDPKEREYHDELHAWMRGERPR